MESIKVTTRLRPSILNDKKIFFKEGNQIIVDDKEKKHCFNFDEIYNEDFTNEQIFNKSVKKNINSSLDGFNYTLFAYGQTGSGKTYTMLGPQNNKQTTNIEEYNVLDNYNGVLVYSLIHLFNKINEDKNSSYFIKASYMEIYNEYIYDLLDENNSQGKPLSIHETKNKDFTVKGLIEEDISSVKEAIQLLKKGESMRRYAESLLKHQSSRSHTVFQIKIKKINNEIVEIARQSTDDAIISLKKKDIIKNSGSKVIESLVNFIDLAGSERTFTQNKQANYNNIDTEEELKSKAKGLMKEGKYINKSLFFLTRVISILSEKKKKVPVNIPFRDSSLTKILKNSLGGNSKTTIILNLHNDIKFVEEGLSTLRFGSNAKKIVNKVQANILTQNSNQSLQILVRNYENKILQLQNTLTNNQSKNTKLSLTIDKLLIQKSNLNNEIKELKVNVQNTENKEENKENNDFIDLENNKKYKELLKQSENIIGIQSDLINKLFEFSKIYWEKINLLTNQYQNEFIYSHEQKIKLLFFEKQEGFTSMSEEDLSKIEIFLNSFKQNLKREKYRREKLLINKDDIKKIIELNKIEIEESKSKKLLLEQFEEKFFLFNNLKSSCSNEIANLENTLKNHNIFMENENLFLEIRELNKANENLDPNIGLLKNFKNIIDKFQSKFDNKKPQNGEDINKKMGNSDLKKKKLYKIRLSAQINPLSLNSTNINDWKEINKEKNDLGINNIINEEDEEEGSENSNKIDNNVKENPNSSFNGKRKRAKTAKTVYNKSNYTSNNINTHEAKRKKFTLTRTKTEAKLKKTLNTQGTIGTELKKKAFKKKNFKVSFNENDIKK